MAPGMRTRIKPLPSPAIGTDRIHALRNARASGIASFSDVYSGFLNMCPWAPFQKGVTIRMGRCNVLNYIDKLI